MSVKPAPQNRQDDLMTVTLVIFGKLGKRKEFTLRDGATVIGRKPEADLRIPLADISRSHCEVSVNGDEVVLRDLGSSNGTLVNDQPVTEATLKAGDRIRLGSAVFTVQINGEPKDIAPVSAGAVDAAGGAARKAASDEVTQVNAAAATDEDEFDLDDLGEISDEEFDVEDLSDLDLGDLGVEDDDLEDVEDLEELSDDDLVAEDED
ncbi:MAG: FHA domain-containing protein [Phycisphaerae bacterium]